MDSVCVISTVLWHRSRGFVESNASKSLFCGIECYWKAIDRVFYWSVEMFHFKEKQRILSVGFVMNEGFYINMFYCVMFAIKLFLWRFECLYLNKSIGIEEYILFFYLNKIFKKTWLQKLFKFVLSNVFCKFDVLAFIIYKLLGLWVGHFMTIY